MKRRRISPVMIAGLIAILSALALTALIASGGVFIQIDPTAQQQTVDVIVGDRLTQTAEKRSSDVTAQEATQSAITQISPMSVPGENPTDISPTPGAG